MDKEMLIVEGFIFPSYKEAQIAQKEQSNIEVIRNRIKDADTQSIYELYCKLVERNMFKTMVGYSFLYELRHCLVTQSEYEEHEIPNVELPKSMEYDKLYELNQGKMETKIHQLTLLKTRMSIVIVALVCVIIGMFVIAVVNPNVGYMNTENKIINKYSTWQEELERREAAVKEKEEQLNMNYEE